MYALLRVSNICSIDHLVISPQDKSFKKPSIDHGVETSPPNIMIGCAIRSYFIDEFNMLSKNSKEHDIVDSWHVAALYNFGMRLLPFTEIYKIFKLEQKNRLKRNIELCVGRVSDQQSWIYLANLFNKLALHVINEVKNEAKTIMMFHLSHFRQMWNELRTIFYDILAHEVENIITRFVGEAGRIYDDNSGIGLSLGSGNEWKSEVRTSGNMLVIDDDINERVRTCGIRDTDLILELLKCCRKIEDSFAAIALKISDNVMPVVKVNNDVNNDSGMHCEIIQREQL